MAAYAEDAPEWDTLSDLMDEEDLIALAPKAAEAEAKLTAVSQAKSEYKGASSEEQKQTAAQAFRAAKKEADGAEAALQNAIVKIASKTGETKTRIAKGMKAWLAEKDLTRRKKLLMAAQSLDLCFVVDVTGSMSMGLILEAVRKEIQGTLDELAASMEHLKYRVAIVAYRDVGDNPRFEVHDFNGDVSACKEFVAGLRARGGGDQCEDVIGGLERAASMDWKYMNRVLLLAADAPCHGTQFHDGCTDNYPSGVFNGSHDASNVLERLAAKGVNFTFLKVNDTTNKMIDVFDEMQGRGWITTMDLNIDPKNPDKKVLRDSIRTSIKEASLSSFTASLSNASKVKSRTYPTAMGRLEKQMGTIDEEESITTVEDALDALDLQGTPSHADVARAFKTKSLISHPDKTGGSSTKFRIITQARDFLYANLPAKSPLPARAGAAEEPATSSMEERRRRLRELKSFLDDDLISQEDYDAEKKRILGSM